MISFHFAPIDWAIIAASIAISFIPALFFWRRAGSSFDGKGPRFWRRRTRRMRSNEEAEE